MALHNTIKERFFQMSLFKETFHFNGLFFFFIMELLYLTNSFRNISIYKFIQTLNIAVCKYIHISWNSGKERLSALEQLKWLLSFKKAEIGYANHVKPSIREIETNLEPSKLSFLYLCIPLFQIHKHFTEARKYSSNCNVWCIRMLF